MALNEAFDDALNRFLASLSDKERLLFSPCASAADLLDGLQKLSFISKRNQRRRGAEILARIKNFSDRLQPYFEVINIFIQSNPQYSAIAWGALRLILQLASNFTTFFEKLTRVLERLGDALPQFEQIPKLFKGNPSHRMKMSLEKVYIDIFQFFQSVARVFTTADGKIKRTPVVIGDLMWKPFDARFSDMLEQMAYHRNLITEEFHLMSAQVANGAEEAAIIERRLAADERQKASEARDKLKTVAERTEQSVFMLEQQMKDRTFHRVREWLNPPSFAQELNNSLDVREEGTGQWLALEPKFRLWESAQAMSSSNSDRKKFSSNALWIYGNAGCGKTVLAASIVDDSHGSATNSSSSNTIVLYFFFRSDSPVLTSSIAAYRALLAQLLHLLRHDQDFVDKFALAMEGLSEGQLTATSGELLDLLHVCAQQPRCISIILDGIDECTDRASLIQNMFHLAANPSIRLLFLSRPNVSNLNRSIPKEFRLQFPKDMVSKDISIYLKHQLEILLEDDLLPDSADIDDLTSRLVNGADGMFLWARLMISYLHSPALTLGQRHRTMTDVILPEGLDTMYTRILKLISRGSTAEQTLARKIFSWLAFAIRPLTNSELHRALTVNDEWSPHDNEIEERFSDFDHTVIMASAGLVECCEIDSTGDGKLGSFRFIHQSVKEFFKQVVQPSLKRTASQETKERFPFLPAKLTAHIELSSFCLQQLTTRSLARPFSGEVGKSVPLQLLNETFPFSSYAAVYWIKHLQSSIMDDASSDLHDVNATTEAVIGLSKALGAFLGKPHAVMSWIEAFYTTFDIIQEHVPLQPIREWISWVKGMGLTLEHASVVLTMADQLHEFIQDLEGLVSSWGPQLAKAPELIWGELTAFTRSRFLAPNSNTKVKPLTSVNHDDPKLSSKCLCTISGMAPDGSFVGVLSIWPSRAYERYWDKLESSGSCSDLQDLCKNWIARFEVWTTKTDPTRTVDIRIPLDDAEIWLQLRQSLRQEITSNWKMAFPVSIGENARAFTILRTYYELTPATVNEPARCQSCKLETDFSDRLQFNWSGERKGFEAFNDSNSHIPLALRMVQHRLYSYAITFSSNGNFLFFADHDPFQPSHLAVFQICSTPELSVQRVANTEYSSMTARFSPLVQVAFHPSRAVLIFSDESDLETRIWVWDFGATMTLGSLQDKISSPIRRLNFSSCGEYILVDSISSTKVIPIPKTMSNEVELKAESLDQTQAPTDIRSGDSICKISELDMSSYKLKAGQVLKGSTLGKLSEFSPLEVSTVSLSDAVNISNGSAVSPRTLQLTKLPQWPGIEHTTPSVIIPAQGDSIITVVLNKAAKAWYSLSEPADEHFPLAINSDSRVAKLTQESATSTSSNHSKWIVSSNPAQYRISGLRYGETSIAFQVLHSSLFDQDWGMRLQEKNGYFRITGVRGFSDLAAPSYLLNIPISGNSRRDLLKDLDDTKSLVQLDSEKNLREVQRLLR